ncbi:hypothetical protein NMD1_02217 [Novosphingobium sp. MD-1]|nr:hypothetical protein NMD1_02217 [Novosphingobium sp. MD-1]
MSRLAASSRFVGIAMTHRLAISSPSPVNGVHFHAKETRP